MKVDREVMNVLSNARVEGAALFLVGQLDRKLYEKGMRTGSESKANYCLAGAVILRKIAVGGRP